MSLATASRATTSPPPAGSSATARPAARRACCSEEFDVRQRQLRGNLPRRSCTPCCSSAPSNNKSWPPQARERHERRRSLRAPPTFTATVTRRAAPALWWGGWLAASTSPHATGASTRKWRAFTRLLGARHLGEGLLLLCLPTPRWMLAGALTHALHAASMMLLARASSAWRNVALASAAPAASLSAYAIRCSRPGAHRRHRAHRGTKGKDRRGGLPGGGAGHPRRY